MNRPGQFGNSRHGCGNANNNNNNNQFGNPNPTVVHVHHHHNNVRRAKPLPQPQVVGFNIPVAPIPVINAVPSSRSAIQWTPSSNGSYPADAIIAGFDNGSPVYVARVTYEKAIIPAKLHASHSSAYAALNGKEVPMKNYEVWV